MKIVTSDNVKTLTFGTYMFYICEQENQVIPCKYIRKQGINHFIHFYDSNIEEGITKIESENENVNNHPDYFCIVEKEDEPKFFIEILLLSGG